ncbi:MAG: hypothetical protein N3A58_03875 [Spirochaetes bacterium]|nr:hypothetical protein [Spirochaetota bacterium]
MIKLKKIGKNLFIYLALLIISCLFFILNSSSSASISYYIEKPDIIKVEDDFEIKIILISKNIDLEILKYPDLQISNLIKLYLNKPIIEKENSYNFNGIFYTSFYKVIIKYKFKALNKGQIDFSGLKLNTNLGQIILNDFSIFISDVESYKADDFIRTEMERDYFYLGEEVKIYFYLYTSNEYDSIKNIKVKDIKDYYYEFLKKEGQLVQMLFLNKPYKKYKIAELKIIPKKEGSFFTPDIEFNIIFNSFEGLEKVKVERVVKSDRLEFKIVPFPQEVPVNFIYLVGNYNINYRYEKLNNYDDVSYILNISFVGEGNHSIIDFSKLLTDNPNYEIVKINQNKTINTCELQYFILIKNKNINSLPSINFSYFNIKENSFKNFIIVGEQINITQKQIDKESSIINLSELNYYKIKDGNISIKLDFLFFKFIMIFNIILFFYLLVGSRDIYSLKVLKKSLNFKQKSYETNYYKIWLDFIEKLINKYNINIDLIDKNFLIFYENLKFIFNKRDINKLYILNNLIKKKYRIANYKYNRTEIYKIKRLIRWLGKLNY